MDSIQIPTVKGLLNRYIIGLACVLVLFTATLRAQQTSGSSVGTVTDNTGAVVAGAAVTLTNVDTGDRRTATTNAAGDYQFVNLLPGNYRIDIEASGIANWDAAVRKSTAITEQVSLQFRAEAFNMWNRVQFGQPSALCCNNSTDKSNASFGVISSQLNLPRVIQFALRLNF